VVIRGLVKFVVGAIRRGVVSGAQRCKSLCLSVLAGAREVPILQYVVSGAYVAVNFLVGAWTREQTLVVKFSYAGFVLMTTLVLLGAWLYVVGPYTKKFANATLARLQSMRQLPTP
jgi:hypothetical protein